MLVLLLTVKEKEVSFAVVLMTTASQMRMRDIECFCDNIISSLPTHPLLQKKQSRQDAIEGNS